MPKAPERSKTTSVIQGRIRLKAATRRLAPFRISHRRPSPWQPKEREEAHGHSGSRSSKR